VGTAVEFQPFIKQLIWINVMNKRTQYSNTIKELELSGGKD